MDQVKARHFGQLPTGKAVGEYSLANAGGLVLKCLTYGGIINELLVPDRAGITADVVLGFRDLPGYLGPHPYFGAITGRVAGRITGGRFQLDGRDYPLAINDPPNHLHGGPAGFDRRLWCAEEVVTPEGFPGIELTCTSPHGESGYPGNVEVAVTYSLTDANEVILRYQASTDQATPFSLTNHSYFNLAGEGSGTIENHVLQIAAREISATDAAMTLLGKRAPVAGQPNDFNRPRRLGDAIPGLLNSHGDNYLLTRPARKARVSAAVLTEPQSGRVMEVLTTEDCLQIYTGAALDGSLTGKSGRPYPRFGGLCLECQGYPDGANHPELGDIILRPGNPYTQTTLYRFKHL